MASSYPQSTIYWPQTSMGQGILSGLTRFNNAMRNYLVDLNPATVLAAVLVAVVAVLLYDFLLNSFYVRSVARSFSNSLGVLASDAAHTIEILSQRGHLDPR